ncbi:MAG TPA: hypothetical protein VK787_09745 [Puia sp.]|jgi:hypothetical protein|nr:hypothetical protein [Puia sp.]
MTKEEKTNQYLAIKSMFQSDNVKKMKDIEKLYPTLIAKSLKINHSRYIQKLYKPEEFTIKQIFTLAKLLDLNPQTILTVIVTQVSANPKFSQKKK